MTVASTTGPGSADDDLGAEAPAEPRGRLSYRERRAESDALGQLARRLVELRPSQLAEVPLSAEVLAEVEQCRALRKNARMRQLRRVSQLLRRLDVDAVREAADDAGHRQRRRAQRERIYEHWRARLVAEGDPALTELVQEQPDVDAQRLRQLLRQARRDPEGPRGKKALRSVLQEVRRAFEAGGDPPPGDDEADEEDGA